MVYLIAAALRNEICIILFIWSSKLERKVIRDAGAYVFSSLMIIIIINNLAAFSEYS